MLRDCHLHSDFSDGKNTIEEMTECAIDLGIKKIVFTDHVRKDSAWIPDYLAEIKRIKNKYAAYIGIYPGVETKVMDFEGKIDCPTDVIDNRQVEKIAAIHRIPDGAGGYICREKIVDDKEQVFEYYCKALNGISKNVCVNRIAHPFSLFGEFGIQRSNKCVWDRLVSIYQKLNKQIEINVKYDMSMVPMNFWNQFRNKLEYGSDSHSVNDMKERVSKLLQWERETENEENKVL